MSVLRESTNTKDGFIRAGQAAKICVSIAAAGLDEVLKEAAFAADAPADMIEWRADAYDDAGDAEALSDALRQLRKAASDMPIMFTYRTSEEGGRGDSDPDAYASAAKTAIDSGCIDYIDVQVFSEAEKAGEITDCAHSKGIYVIASYHDFERTPSADELCERFEGLKAGGADIIKIAVMASDEEDLGRLLEAATVTRAKHPAWPLIAIAMGEAGMQSRIEAEKFGSCIIYAAGSRQTAPGQIGVDDLIKLRSALG